MYKGINVTFQNLKTLEGREGLIIQADIKYNGKKIATYRDDGNSGCVDIEAIGGLTNAKGEYEKSKAYIENSNLLADMNAEFAALPKAKYEFAGGSSELDECIEFAMDEFITNRELLKDAKKGLLVQENKDSSGYSIIQWKVGSITTMLKKYSKAQVVTLLEKTIREEVSCGKYIPCQDYYVSIGVNPSVFAKA